MSAVTDSLGHVQVSEDQPGITNLLTIFAGATGTSVEEAANTFSDSKYGDFKKAVADAVIALLEPVRKKYEDLMANKDYLQQVLKEGNEKAQKRAYKTLGKVYRKAGFMERPR